MDPHTQPPETQHCLCIFEKSEDASSLPFRGKDPEVTRNMSTDAPHRELCLARRARVWLPLCPLLSSAATFDVHSGAAPPHCSPLQGWGACTGNKTPPDPRRNPAPQLGRQGAPCTPAASLRTEMQKTDCRGGSPPQPDEAPGLTTHRSRGLTRVRGHRKLKQGLQRPTVSSVRGRRIRDAAGLRAGSGRGRHR